MYEAIHTRVISVEVHYCYGNELFIAEEDIVEIVPPVESMILRDEELFQHFDRFRCVQIPSKLLKMELDSTISNPTV